MENMVHMFGGTSKKSTLIDEKITRFPREDESSPRQAILESFCPDSLKEFKSCMAANGFDENQCLQPKGVLDGCAKSAFKEVNAAGAGNWVF